MHDVDNKFFMRWMPKLFFASIFISLWFIPQIFDDDIYFLLHSGQYVMQNGIPHIEPFTLHENMHFVMQQWLSDVIFWQLYQHGGGMGIMTGVYAVAATTLAIYYRLCMLASGKNWYISSALSLFFGLLVCLTFMVSRPQIFSTCLLLLAVFCLESYVQKKKVSFLLTLPVLSVLLINMHAAIWGVLLCVTGAYLTAAIVQRKHQEKMAIYLLAAMLGIFFAGFLNPYGSESMLYVINSYGVPLIDKIVREMDPLSIDTLLNKIYVVVMVSVWVVYIKRKLPLRHLLLCLGLTWMALSAFRSVFLFLMLGTFPLAGCLAAHHLDFSRHVVSRRRLVFRIVMFLGIVAFGVYGVYHAFNGEEKKAPQLWNPHPTVDYLLTLAPTDQIVLWNTCHEGSYAELKGIKSYMDTRAEIFIPANNGQKDILREYYDVAMGYRYYEEVFEQYGINYVLASEYEVLYEYLMHDEHYELLYEEQHPRESHRLFRRMQ